MRRVLIGLLVVTGVISAWAQQPSAAGSWSGRIGPAADAFGIVVNLQNRDGAWTGTLELAQNGRGVPLGNITNAGLAISFSIAGVPGSPTFKGNLSDDGQTIEGDFTQENVRLPFTLSRNAPGQSTSPFDAAHVSELIDQLTSFAGPLAERPFVAPLSHPAIEYGIRPRKDPVAELNRKIQEGTAQLEFEGEQG